MSDSILSTISGYAVGAVSSLFGLSTFSNNNVNTEMNEETGGGSKR